MTTVFFYGLFLDPDILIELGYSPKNFRLAKLENYALVIGERANMVATKDGHVWGSIIEINQKELDQLYSEKSVSDYQSKTVSSVLENKNTKNAQTYILPEDYIMKAAKNNEYAIRLLTICQKYNFPEYYLDKLNAIIDEIGKK